MIYRIDDIRKDDGIIVTAEMAKAYVREHFESEGKSYEVGSVKLHGEHLQDAKGIELVLMWAVEFTTDCNAVYEFSVWAESGDNSRGTNGIYGEW